MNCFADTLAYRVLGLSSALQEGECHDEQTADRTSDPRLWERRSRCGGRRVHHLRRREVGAVWARAPGPVLPRRPPRAVPPSPRGGYMPPHPCGCVGGNDLRGGPRVRPPALTRGASDLDAAG